MAENSLRLRVILDMADKALAPLKRMDKASKETAGALKAAREQLKQLDAQQNALGNFSKHTKALRETGNQLQVLKQQLQAMTAAGTASAAQLQKQQAAIDKQTGKYREQQSTVFKLRNALTNMGISSASQAQQRIGADIAATTAKINAQTEALKRQGAQQRKLTEIQSMTKRGATIGGAMTASGMGAAYVGRRGLQEVGGLMGQSKLGGAEEIRIKALGMGQSDTAAALDYAKNFKSYGTSETDNLALMRDAVTVFNDAHHAQDAMPFLAKMKFANEAAFGAADGAEHDRKFMDMMKVIEMRNGANSREDFERNGNLVQQVLTATGGRVGAEDWLHLIKTGGVAAKGLSEKEFFYRLEPLVQEMGGDRVGTGMMSAYQNLYQGRTTKRSANLLDELGLIADPTKVKHDKVGQIAQLGVGALKGSELFQKSQFQWMESVLIPALQAKGYTSEKQILDAMGGIFSNRNAAGLFATMYQQRSMVNKSYALNERADDVDTLHGRVVDGSAGKEIELRKRLDDLKKTVGDTALPAYVNLLDMLARAAKGVQGFAQRHPGLVKALVYSAAALSALAMASGLLLIPLGLLVAKSMALRWILARLGMTTGPMTLLWNALKFLYSWGGRAVMGLARIAPMLLRVLGPVGLLATAAWMVYSNWEDMVGGAKLLWEDLTNAVTQVVSVGMALWQGFVNFLGGLWTGFLATLSGIWIAINSTANAAWTGMATQFTQFGGWIIDGLIGGITNKLGELRDTVVGAATSASQWFKEKLGINSPSRVFTQYGGWISEGAALGIEGGQAAVRAAALAMAASAMVPMGAGAADAGSAFAPSSMITAGGTALAARPAAVSAPAGSNSYTITINPAPGMDPQAIARAVAAELDRRELAAGARRRSALQDLN